MINKIKNVILSRFRTICLYEANKNKKKLKFIDFNLIIFRKFQSIKDKDKNQFKDLFKKKKRFRNKQYFLALYFKNNIVSTGWMYQGLKWHVMEIDKEIDIKNKILLYDFFTLKKYRNRGFYSKILKLIRNLKTNKKFLIYCLSSNYSSKKGIENSKFRLIKTIKK